MRTLFRLGYPVAPTVIACWLVFRFHGRPRLGIDDAQILFSYSSNLVAGRGLLYANNPEHVEGVTSLLWTLICAVPFQLGLNESGVLAISVLLLCLAQVLVIDIIRKSAVGNISSWPYELAYLVPILSCPAYFTWMSITLMDTCLWGFLVVLMIYVVLVPPRSPLGTIIAAIPFLLAPLSRPEAVLVVPSIILLAALLGGSGRSPSPQLVLIRAGAFLLSVAAVTAFRVSYFGYPVPNTFYAKVSPSPIYNLREGMDYLVKFGRTSGPIIGASVLFLMGLAAWYAGVLESGLWSWLRMRRRHLHRITNWMLPGLVAVVLLIAPVLTGGDHFAMFRFYQPVYPLMILTPVLLLMAWLPSGGASRSALWSLLKRYPVAAALLSLWLVYWAYFFSQVPSWSMIRQASPIKHEFGIAEYGIRDGRRLSELFTGADTFPTIGVVTAGGIARTYRGRIVDLMGLNSETIAHFPGDRKGMKSHSAFEKAAFFRFVKIDVLVASPPRPPETANVFTVTLKGLLYDPQFVKDWRYGVLSRSERPDDAFEAFYSTGFLDRLEATARYRFRETMVWANTWVVVGSASDTERDSSRSAGLWATDRRLAAPDHSSERCPPSAAQAEGARSA